MRALDRAMNSASIRQGASALPEKLAPWSRMSLARRFAIVSFGVLLAGMLVIGWWVSSQIQQGVVQNTATATALYMNSFVAPEIRELEDRETLSAQARDAVLSLHRDTPLAERIVSFKIWGPGGRVLFSTREGVEGQSFAVTNDLAAAWQGEVRAELSELDDPENAAERSLGSRLLEIYSPIRASGSDEIIAVAEFYATADELKANLMHTRVYSWLVVAAVTLSMFAALFTIVRGGSQTIERQQRELRARVDELSLLLRHNAELHKRVRSANDRALAINERFLRRVSAELHDGPAQALGFTLLRLDAIKHAIGGDGRVALDHAVKDIDSIRGALEEALGEIRNLSSGLAMPELDNMTLQQSVERLLRVHERRSGTQVEAVFDDLPESLPLPIKIGVYRLVQEALNNASRHGGGAGQRVELGADSEQITVCVSDTGPGFDPADMALESGHLGLAGMRERVESLGGSFTVESSPGQGTRVIAVLPIQERSTQDA